MDASTARGPDLPLENRARSGLSRLTKLTQPQRRFLIFLALGLAFIFRLAFGLCSPLWTGSEDEKQIYLIGLKFFTTRAWPWFGPDVTNTIQIPGTFRGLDAIHYVDLDTGLHASFAANGPNVGEYLGGWKSSGDQLDYLLSQGKL